MSLETEESQSFAKEMRQELKSFARRYNLKIVWRKKTSDTQDATAAFLEYWDKGLSHEEPNKVMSFAKLCTLSVVATNSKEAEGSGSISKSVLSTPVRPQKTSFMRVLYTNWEFLKAAFKRRW
jgi:hypothetical protein